MSKQAKRNNCISKRKGFTLVELIVVLAILAILASAAVMSLIGYIDKSRFDSNEQNAQNIYQAVQTALVRKKNSGEIERWIKDTLLVEGVQDPCDTSSQPNNDRDAAGNVLDSCFDQTAFDAFDTTHNSVGESVHMRYTLTYQKGGSGTDNDNAIIQDLVGGYFYDTSILNATFTIEFDVEKTIGGDERLHYAVNTYAVFYDEKRTEWDPVAKKETSGVVPWREFAYRSDTSLVGYFNGGNPAAVDSVYTPLINKQMDFAELAMRNGEKLELSFSVMYDGANVTGKGLLGEKETYIHYTASLYDTHPKTGEFTPGMQDDKWLMDLVISEAYLTSGRPDGRKPVDYMTPLKAVGEQKLGNGSVVKRNIAGTDYDVLCTIDRMTDDTNKSFVRYKASIETTAMVYVNTKDQKIDYNSLEANKLTEGNFYKFPLTISYVRKEYADADPKEYISYTIALDAMMSRYAAYVKDNNSSVDKTYNYSITRLFMPYNDVNNDYTPKNIRVAMTAAADAFSDPDLTDYNLTSNLPASENVNAKRAYDDPVYFVEDGKYVYKNPEKCDPEECATRDIGGYAVCNTLFGDLGYGSFGNENDYVDRGKNNIPDKVQLASITSFRHLYNMRYTKGISYAAENKPVVYEIQRDLDWYRKIKDTQDDYTSEVVVYGFVANKKNTPLTGYSPVGHSRGVSKAADLKLVSWPALPEVSVNQTLVAVENAVSADTEDKTAVIRNVQMRRQSFMSTDAHGVGMICTNNGTIRNIRCENLCLVLENIVDGSANTEKLSGVVDTLFSYGDSVDQDYKQNRPNLEETNAYLGGKDGRGYIPIGGLIGEHNGSLGEEGSDSTQNTIRMSNTIVLAGAWDGSTWKLFKMFDGTGGVVGVYTSGAKAYGTIETCGRFAISGAQNVGGVIGQVQGMVDARLSLDSGKEGESENTVISYPDGVRALVMGRTTVGGAIGYMKGGHFAQDVTQLTYNVSNEGVVTIADAEKADYAVDVNLAENTYVWQFGKWYSSSAETYEGIGGAVGRIDNHPADMMLSVRAINKGLILSGNTGDIISGKYVGGAIGYINGGSASQMYIYAENKGLIGTKDGISPFGKGHSASAGIAYMHSFGKNGAPYVLDVINEGSIACNTNNKGNTGIGVALGANDSGSCPSFQIRAVNKGTILATNQEQEDSGAGGAVGYLLGLQNGSHIYALQEENAVLSATGNNVGGAVGCIKGEAKGTKTNLITITATIMNSDGICGTGDNVGGCAGYLRKLKEYAAVRTQVMVDCGIYGRRNVGGVVGCSQTGGDTAGTQIVLQGTADAPRLVVCAQDQGGNCTSENINAGGCVGMSGLNAKNTQTSSTEYKSATQTSDDRMILDVKGYSQIGGLVGGFYLCNTNGVAGVTGILNYKALDFSITLHPQSSIQSVGDYAGGAVGIITDGNPPGADGSTSVAANGKTNAHFYANISAMLPKNGTQPYVSASNCAGGAVGAFYISYMDGKVSTYLGSTGAVTGQAGVGGAVGYCSLTQTMGDVTAVLDAEAAITAEKQAGGCIGSIGESGVYTSVKAILGAEEGVGSVSPIYGNNRVGGCIGWVEGNNNPVIKNAATTVNTTGNIITRNPGSVEELCCLGGVVGGMTQSGTLENAIVDGNSTELFMNVPECKDAGGIAGYLESANVLVQNMQIVPSVTISGQQNLGGYIGQMDGAVVGTAESTLEVTGIRAVAATAATSHAGGVIGLVANGGTWNSNIQFAPVADCAITGGDSVGGVIGEVDHGIVAGNISFAPAAAFALTGGNNAGGLVGCSSGNISGAIEFKPVAGCTVTGSGNNIGGLFGKIEAGSVNGTKEIVLGSQCSVSGHESTGGMIGLLQGGATAYGNADLRLAAGSRITGTVHTGGMIGQVDNGDIGQGYGTDAAQNLTVHLAGGYVVGSGQGLGGVVGTMGKGSAGNLTTYVEYAYSQTNVSASAINTGNSHYPGVGGVVGQMSWEGNATSEVKVDGMFLRLKNDFAILSGKNSVGGVLGRCESQNGEILDMSVKSEDGNTHKLILQPNGGNAFDVGGVAGYLYGTLKQSITMDKITVTAKGVSGVGGWIGSLDGKLGETPRGGTLTATGTMNITASSYGAGGVIGTMGRWHASGVINYDLIANLKDSTIECSGSGESAGVGGIIGNAGAVEKGSNNKDYAAVFNSDLTVTLSNVTINGTVNAGGMIGYIKAGTTLGEDRTTYVNVATASYINAAANCYAGGIVGSNSGNFLANPIMNVSADYYITAGTDGYGFQIFGERGYVGTVMGRNLGAFGRTSTTTYTVPVTGGDKVQLRAGKWYPLGWSCTGYTGYILGYAHSAPCGILTQQADGTYVAKGSGTLTYITSVKRTGHEWNNANTCDGYCGRNEPLINSNQHNIYIQN